MPHSTGPRPDGTESRPAGDSGASCGTARRRGCSFRPVSRRTWMRSSGSGQYSSLSLSHQNWRLRAGDRRDGAGRMGAEWVWRAWGTHRPALPRTFPRHHVDPGQSEGLPGEKGSLK